MTTIRIQGYVVRADVLQPFTTYHDEKERYELTLLPYNPDTAHQLEYQIEEVKRQFYMAQPASFYHEENNHPSRQLEDRVFENDCIKFESLFQPRLEGELSDLLHDDELWNRFVQVVGNVQIQERGNCFLSFHIVEAMPHPATGFDN